MSSCSCRWAALPIRTGREPRYPSRWSSVCSIGSVRPSMPYMSCNGPLSPPVAVNSASPWIQRPSSQSRKRVQHPAYVLECRPDGYRVPPLPFKAFNCWSAYWAPCSPRGLNRVASQFNPDAVDAARFLPLGPVSCSVSCGF